MSQRTQVLLIDDLDGSEADETVSFGLDGSTYEIDLSEKNADQLRELLADYVAHGRRGAGRHNGTAASGRRRTPASSNGRSAGSGDTADIRAWARDNGYAVNERGRIATAVLEAYRAAH